MRPNDPHRPVVSPSFTAGLMIALPLALALWALVGLAIIVAAGWLARRVGDPVLRWALVAVIVWCGCLLEAVRRIWLRIQLCTEAARRATATATGTGRVAELAQGADAAAAAVVRTAGAWRSAAGLAEQFADEVGRTDFAGDPEAALRHLAWMLKRGADQLTDATG